MAAECIFPISFFSLLRRSSRIPKLNDISFRLPDLGLRLKCGEPPIAFARTEIENEIFVSVMKHKGNRNPEDKKYSFVALTESGEREMEASVSGE